MRKKIISKLPKPLSLGEETLAMQMRADGVKFIREFKFHPLRKWRFDFIIDVLSGNYAIEVEGGTWARGRHTTGKGFEEDCEKYSEAAVLGWQVFRFTTDQVTSGYAIDCIKRGIQGVI